MNEAQVIEELEARSRGQCAARQDDKGGHYGTLKFRHKTLHSFRCLFCAVEWLFIAGKWQRRDTTCAPCTSISEAWYFARAIAERWPAPTGDEPLPP